MVDLGKLNVANSRTMAFATYFWIVKAQRREAAADAVQVSPLMRRVRSVRSEGGMI